MSEVPPKAPPEAPPPLLGSWRNLYGAVLGLLAALVAIFYAVTRWAS
jgi:hypothetical protein